MMQSISEQIHPGLIGILLAAAMLAAWRLGLWLAGRQPSDADPPDSKVADAAMALLGLLLAFTFSMSLTKHDERRHMVLNESNAIGDFYTCVSLQKEPLRQRLQTLVRGYLEHKLDAAHHEVERGPELEALVQQSQQAHSQMTVLVSQALSDGTPSAVPLINTLNNLTSSHAARILAIRDRLPWSIILVLFIAAIAGMLLQGRQQGAHRKPALLGTACFIVLVSLVVFVTLDLNQPGHGLITVGQETMERLLAGIGP
jgi:hypothetical protein